MNCLLDTHSFLWFLRGDKRLGEKARLVIENPKNNVYLSVASVWEITIKVSLGKLELKESIEETVEKSDFEIIDIELDHILELTKLSNYHRDPFDRILVAQALVENLVIITNDEKIKKYGIETIS